MDPLERIVSRILLVRGQKVMLDADLAELYGISTGRFNQQVRRNRNRFRLPNLGSDQAKSMHLQDLPPWETCFSALDR